jgi:hypothetical protein
MKNPLNTHTNWWLLWGIFSPVFVLFSIFSAIFINPFTMIFFELGKPAFFGLWVYNKENFKINSYKFTFLLVAVSILAVILGKVFAWISVGIMLILLKVIGFGKSEFFWSFGAMILYGVLGLIPVFTLIFSNQIEIDVVEKVLGRLSFIYLIVIIIAYFARGAVFGFIMQKCKK